MKRSDFLAIIPSLSAIPFIGKEIIRKSDRIEIFQPEEMEKEINYSHDTELHIVKNGRILAKGFITAVEANRDMIDVSCRDNNGARSMLPGIWEIRVEGIINGPMTTEAMNAMSDITSKGMRYFNYSNM